MEKSGQIRKCELGRGYVQPIVMLLLAILLLVILTGMCNNQIEAMLQSFLRIASKLCESHSRGLIIESSRVDLSVHIKSSRLSHIELFCKNCMESNRPNDVPMAVMSILLCCGSLSLKSPQNENPNVAWPWPSHDQGTGLNQIASNRIGLSCIEWQSFSHRDLLELHRFANGNQIESNI